MPPITERMRRLEPRWRLYLPLLAIVAIALVWGPAAMARKLYPRQQILDAIRHVESASRADPPDGDGGAAIGPFQIHRVYWHDALVHDPTLGGTYEHCRDLGYATRVVAAYMERWVPDAWRAGDAEVIARVHNGGPEGMRKAATLRYWQKVRSRLR